MAKDDGKIDNHKTDFSEAELAGLSEEERAALLEKTDDPDVLRAVAGPGADGDDDDDAETPEEKAAREKEEAEAAAAKKAKEDADAKAAEEAEKKKREAELAAMNEEDRKKAEAEDRAKAEAAATAKAEADAKVKAEADAKKRAESADDDDAPFLPAYQAKPPENYDAQVKALEERKAEATQKYKANEMELDEMLAEHAKVDAERRKLDDAKLKADISAEQQEQYGAQQWKWECSRFIREVMKHEGIDYKQNNGLYAALDAEVIVLGNDDKNKDWTGRQFLEAAHERVKAQFGLAAKPKPDTGPDADKERRAADEAAKKKAELERQQRADANRQKLPKGVSGLPAAGAGESANEGEFAHLDGLSNMEYENAVARLTPEQQDRWARE